MLRCNSGPCDSGSVNFSVIAFGTWTYLTVESTAVTSSTSWYRIKRRLYFVHIVYLFHAIFTIKTYCFFPNNISVLNLSIGDSARLLWGGNWILKHNSDKFQPLSRRFRNAEKRVRRRASPLKIYGEQFGTCTGFSLSISLFPCQYHFINVSYASSV
jgi:hypothetical protein